MVRDTFLRGFYRQFARILTIGAESRAHYRRLGYPEQRLIFAPYCVDTSVFAPASGAPAIRSEFNLPDDQIVLLFFGQLRRAKAPIKLIAAPPVTNCRARGLRCFFGRR
ncbi:MAG: hypothetical protein IPK17_22300 [Chloroflexi bacterium]|uniref:hypothetical protein n=1 Tax=Candidatus Flexifilum breve TaxID=3140694 RepID=UPI00313768AF|nr:hypothetical protein [Chloroflexota bacterium]